MTEGFQLGTFSIALFTAFSSPLHDAACWELAESMRAETITLAGSDSSKARAAHSLTQLTLFLLYHSQQSKTCSPLQVSSRRKRGAPGRGRKGGSRNTCPTSSNGWTHQVRLYVYLCMCVLPAGVLKKIAKKKYILSQVDICAAAHTQMFTCVSVFMCMVFMCFSCLCLCLQGCQTHINTAYKHYHTSDDLCDLPDTQMLTCVSVLMCVVFMCVLFVFACALSAGVSEAYHIAYKHYHTSAHLFYDDTQMFTCVKVFIHELPAGVPMESEESNS